MQYRIDFKESIEKITSFPAYPVVIPNNAKYPAIELNITGGTRNSESSLDDNNIKDLRVSITICAAKSSICYIAEKALTEAYDNKTFSYGETKALIMYLDSSVEIYNYGQNLYELTLDFSTKKLK